MITESWFNRTSDVRRYNQVVSDQEETGTRGQIYSALPTAVAGLPSSRQNSMLGHLTNDEILVTWREKDIDGNGWPQEGDFVILSGKSYRVIELEDHTQFASHFTIPRHKVAKLKEQPLPP